MKSETSSLISLEGLRAVVTGGGSGIGQGISKLYAAAGAEVLVVDQRGEAAQSTVDQIVETGGSAEALELDVTKLQEVERALEGRPIDIVVNAAGIIVRKGLLETTEEEWNRVIGVNLTGYFNVLKAALPALAASDRGGRIVQIVSMNAHIGYGYPAYTAAKGGVLSLSRQLASELAPQGIRINSISPGVVETGINRDTLGTSESIRNTTIGATPLGRLGAPADIAKAALFLASDLSGFITGVDLLVDGGMLSQINWGAAADELRNAHSDRLLEKASS